ncbi:MAG: toll/interleukin-1 receptor domain-containing protein [Flavobacteriales bacterium]
MKTKYQIILIGNESSFIEQIKESLNRHTDELGVLRDSIIYINETNFVEYKANAPAVCLYFGANDEAFKNLSLLKTLISDATLIIPLVENLEIFRESIPEQLHKINGYKLSEENDIEGLVSVILEGLSLLRLSRRLFISYKRDESSTIAIQLFEQFEKNGFDVFLDTHSVRYGEPFQDELWHRLADTDVVVLLNTPGFVNSDWTTQELARANAMSVGILQLIWPDHDLELEAKLSIPYRLQDSDFGNSAYAAPQKYLTNTTINQIVSEVESLRARSLASRQDNIITEFIKGACRVGKEANLQPEKFILINKSDDEELVFIPTVGVPQSFTYNQSEELIKQVKKRKTDTIYILYDHINIREKWIKHLSWLDNYLPVKALKIEGIEQWLEHNV